MKRSGFSLIELLVVLAIFAVLAALSVPIFSEQVAKSRIKTAQSDLELMSVMLENRYQRVLSYPTNANQTTTDLQSVIPKWIPASDATNFNFANINPTAASYSITATGLGGLLEDCVITMTSAGAKNISDCTQLSPDGSWL